MKIAFTTGSLYNPLISCLIQSMPQGIKVAGIISTEKPRNFFDRIYGLFLLVVRKGFLKTYIFTKHRILAGPKKVNKYKYLEELSLKQGMKEWDKSLLELTKEHKLKLIYCRNINESSIIEYIKNEKIDLLINCGGGIFKKEIINSPNFGILNNHMAKLPEFRGMNVLEWSIFYNKPIGVTAHFIDESIDTGDILIFKEIAIAKDDDITNLRAKVQPLYFSLVNDCIGMLKSGNYERIKQLPEEGKQYFVMHPRLKIIVECKLSKIVA